jgi:hypothetical protein
MESGLVHKNGRTGKENVVYTHMEYYADIKKNKTIIFRETHGTVDHCVK